MAVDKARPNKRKEKHTASSSPSSQTKKKQKKGGGSHHDGKKKVVKEEDSGSNSAKRRQLKKERQSHRRHADVVAEAKLIWNKLRLKEGGGGSSSISDEKKALMDTLMTLIRGKIYDIALQHDASRVVQAAIQFGTKEQRKEILTELLQTTTGDANHSLPELSKVQYAHFVTLKLIKYCSRDDDSVKLIVKSFKGSIPKLAVHTVGARVVESLFLTFPTKSTLGLKQELYGPHFSLFFDTSSSSSSNNKSAATSLKSHLQQDSTTETQKQATLTFVKDILSKGITKGFFGHTYFQELLVEYMDVVTSSSSTATTSSSSDTIRDMIPSIVDHSIHLLSTRSGARVVALCASYATPKDRKRIMRSLKGYTKSSLLHKDAYLALLRLIQVTDDTVSVNKSILNELVTLPTKGEDGDEKKDDTGDGTNSSPLLEVALDETASKLFLLLLVKDDQTRMKYFDPYERSILFPEKVPTITEGGQEIPTSKKDPELRRNELLKYVQKGLVELCSNPTDVQQLVQSLPGSRVLKEVYTNVMMPSSSDDNTDDDSDGEPIVKALMKVCSNALDGNDDDDDDDEEQGSDDDDEQKFSLFEDPIGHLVIKNIILVDAANDSDDDKTTFSKEFVKQLGGRLLDVAKSNRGAFVVSSLLKVPSVRRDVLAKLGPKTSDGKKLKKLFQSKKKKGDSEQPTAGYEALLKELSA